MHPIPLKHVSYGGLQCFVLQWHAMPDAKNQTYFKIVQDICNYLDLEFSSINASMVSHQLNLATVSAECRAAFKRAAFKAAPAMLVEQHHGL